MVLTVGLLSSTPRRLSLEASFANSPSACHPGGRLTPPCELDYVGATLDQESVGRPIETLNAFRRNSDKLVFQNGRDYLCFKRWNFSLPLHTLRYFPRDPRPTTLLSADTNIENSFPFKGGFFLADYEILCTAL